MPFTPATRFSSQYLAAALFALSISGCALSPQQIAIKPQIVVEPRDYGKQQQLIVETLDERSNDILGVRGGVYKDTSIIQLENAFSKAITREVIKALSSWGFDPIETSSQKLPEFTLSVQSIDYETNDRTVANTITTTIKMALKVQWGKTAYAGNYSASRSRTFIKAPTEAANTRLINELSSAVLQEIFDDPELAAFLQKQVANQKSAN
ncbi:MAG: hypothetical protein KDI30_03255 [Pseudomonadales bacterium]|nr:hypothetical protein [Pseudomonadales bacterium]